MNYVLITSPYEHCKDTFLFLTHEKNKSHICVYLCFFLSYWLECETRGGVLRSLSSTYTYSTFGLMMVSVQY